MMNKNIFGYSVKIDSKRIYYYRSPEKWGEWKSEYLNQAPDCITIVDHSSEECDVITELEFNHGEIAYLVWVEWSSGDSFGIGINSQTEPLGLFKDRKSAEELKEEILKANEKKTHDHIILKTSDGQSFNIYIYPDWHWYFERLENVYISNVTILLK